MILSLSTASHLYWLGRYMVRVQGLCRLDPFASDQRAVEFAAAFGLPAWNVETLEALLNNPEQSGSLMSNLSAIQANVQSVRGVLAQPVFECFNTLWRLRTESRQQICQHLAAAQAAMESQHALIQAFWLLGETIETADLSLRLRESPQEAIHAVRLVLPQLPEAWQSLQVWLDRFAQSPDGNHFYSLCQAVHDLLAEGV